MKFSPLSNGYNAENSLFVRIYIRYHSFPQDAFLSPKNEQTGLKLLRAGLPQQYLTTGAACGTQASPAAAHFHFYIYIYTYTHTSTHIYIRSRK